MTPSVWERYGRSFSSWMGSASISKRNITVGASSVTASGSTTATTPVPPTAGGHLQAQVAEVIGDDAGSPLPPGNPAPDACENRAARRRVGHRDRRLLAGVARSDPWSSLRPLLDAATVLSIIRHFGRSATLTRPIRVVVRMSNRMRNMASRSQSLVEDLICVTYGLVAPACLHEDVADALNAFLKIDFILAGFPCLAQQFLERLRSLHIAQD